MRELLWASQAKQESEWGRWSILLSMTYNAHRDPKKTSSLGAEDFNPFSKKQKAQDRDEIEVPFDTLKLLVSGATR